MLRRRPIFGLALIASVSGACQPADARSRNPALKQQAKPQSDATGRQLLQPYDHYYGIYLNGIKVGWMRNRMTVGDQVVLRVDLEASIGGMGRVSRVTLAESRTYDVRSRRLVALSFAQGASTGVVRVTGTVTGTSLEIEVEAGKAKKKQTISVDETIDDALAVDRLARAARVGAKATSTRFDASIQKTLQAEHVVLAVEDRVLGGVTAKVVKIETRYLELGVTEISWLDNTGKVLESRVGGFFVARLEPPDVAKRLDYQQDLLVSAVVRPPQPVHNPQTVETMKLHFKGFGSALPPASRRQQVRADGSTVALTLRRYYVPRSVPYPLSRHDLDDAEYLEATPFIQSDAKEIVVAAKRAVGNATDVFTVVSRLSHYVYHHVRDEYVPAYSNALDALRSGRGDCTEHAILFVALARALRLPSRVAVGIAYWPPGDGFGWHAWAEVKVDGIWYSVDPTWDQASADATHIKLAGGGPAEQARIVMLLGRLEIVAMEIL